MSIDKEKLIKALKNRGISREPSVKVIEKFKLGPKGDRGEKGPQGERGFSGRDAKNGKDGKDGIDGKNGQDGSSDTGVEIVNKINDLPKNAYSPKIDAFHIANLPAMMKQHAPTIYAPGRGGAGGGVAGGVGELAFAGSGTYSQATGTIQFSNSNGLTFGLSNNGILTASHNGLTTAALSQDSSLYRFTSADSQLQFTSANSNFRFTSADSQLQFTSANSNFRFTSADSQLQFTSANSNFVHASAAFAGTSASGTIASNGISISIGPYITTAMLSNAATISNIKVSGGTSSANLSAITFADGNGVTFGLNGSTMTASVAAGAAAGTLSYFRNIPLFAGTTNNITQPNNNSIHHIYPFLLDANLTASYLRYRAVYGAGDSTSIATTASSRTGGKSMLATISVGIFTRATGANSDVLQYYTSTSGGVTAGYSFSIAAAGTQMSSTYGMSFQSGPTATNTTFGVSESTNSYRAYSSHYSRFTGNKMLDIPFNMSLPPNNYWLGLVFSSTFSTDGFTNAAFNGWRGWIPVADWPHVTQMDSQFDIFGDVNGGNTNRQYIGLGSWTTNSIISTSSYALTQITTQGKNIMLGFEFNILP